jgi:DNA-binding NarL/FixJ family response regulator
MAPDVLVMDIAMPHLTGIQATERIRNLDVATRVVILSMHSDETLVRQALRSGAKGYLLKRSVTAELLLALRAASRGETYLSPAVSSAVVAGFLRLDAEDDGPTPFDRLTPRERQVLQLVAEGHTNNATAQFLKISVKTVEKHRANLMAKLGVSDVRGLLRVAVKHGLVFLDE